MKSNPRLLLTKAPISLIPHVLMDTELADLYIKTTSPIGKIAVVFNQTKVVAVEHQTRRMTTEYFERTGRKMIAAPSIKKSFYDEINRAIQTGSIGELSIDFDQFDPFQRAVLEAICSIPPGEVRPYNWVAQQIGRPKANRAVGTALSKNPIPVIVPCHRVIRSDGRIGNYAFGASAKAKILRYEGLDIDQWGRVVES